MVPFSTRPGGLYFEEFEIGRKIITAGRTVTESDIVSFAGLSGDFNQIHTNAQFSEQTPIGQRIAHGLLGLSIASGLIDRTGTLDGTVIVFREIENWKFVKPIFIGDTIHVELSVFEKKAMPRVGGGTVKINLRVINQHDETVMKGVWNVLMASRPEE